MDVIKLGLNIKKIRKMKGLTQRDLASKISKTESSIRKYEKGLVDIPNRVISDLAKALDVTINDLIESESIENNIDLTEFEPEVVDYLMLLKDQAFRLMDDDNIDNLTLVQNIIIDHMANEYARKELRLSPIKPYIHEFKTDKEGNLLKGKRLLEELINYYKDIYIDEKIEILKKNFSRITQYEGVYYEKMRNYFNDIPKYRIPDYIVEKLYPEIDLDMISEELRSALKD